MKRVVVWGLLGMLWSACGPGVDHPPGGGEEPLPTKDSTPPRITSVVPENGALQVENTAALTVTFSEPMNVESVMQAFSVEETATLTMMVVMNPAATVLTATSTAPFPPGQQIHWHVGSGAKDRAGNALQEPMSGQFTVKGAAKPEVRLMTPDDGEQNVAPREPLRITFSQPMNRAATEAAFFITGASGQPGSFAWDAEGTSLVFTPDAPWAWDQQVEWGVRAAAMDSTGGSLGGTRTSRFKVMALDVTRPTVVGPTPGAKGIPQDFDLGLTFSEPMDRLSTSGALLVTAKQGTQALTVVGTLSWSADSRVLTFHGHANSGSFIDWSLTSSATDRAGNALVAASGKDVMRIIRSEQAVLKLDTTTAGRVTKSLTSDYRYAYHNTNVEVGDVTVAGGSGLHRSRAFASYDMTPIDPNATRITAATLSIYQDTLVGDNPYTQWGTLSWTAVDYGKLDTTDYDLAGGATGTLSTSATPDWLRVDITALADSRWKNRQSEGSRLSFRMAFDGAMDNVYPRYTRLLLDGVSVASTIAVTYEVP
ncbi:Ig-like domain-containing protein [Corallococcus sp. M34]|uniref:Ig-like domain-containing protein n=1 Tax=Citreicoccus inhibens TaxID=2849499 RepID=UPI001C216443|nr:Ig-like domain-containing protein [Citreicoccus inhibens]MBU8899617.1 Ig-like domain-containing protein [Citreicoccus inhibens]